ncbi:Uncharacterised protein [Mycobacterium tuberculosis]|nr:Uncharacterised protein [Mycobacterium tuberculosis]
MRPTVNRVGLVIVQCTADYVGRLSRHLQLLNWRRQPDGLVVPAKCHGLA